MCQSRRRACLVEAGRVIGALLMLQRKRLRSRKRRGRKGSCWRQRYDKMLSRVYYRRPRLIIIKGGNMMRYQRGGDAGHEKPGDLGGQNGRVVMFLIPLFITR